MPTNRDKSNISLVEIVNKKQPI